MKLPCELCRHTSLAKTLKVSACYLKDLIIIEEMIEQLGIHPSILSKDLLNKDNRGWSSIIRTDVFGAGVYIFAERASWYGKKSFIIKLSLKWGIVRLCSLNNTHATDQKVFSFKMQFSPFCKKYILFKWWWIFSTMELKKMIFFASNFMW